mgnify:CR=1 FL=1
MQILIILLVLVVLALSVNKLSKAYREHFNRNFILNETAWVILFSSLIMFLALASGTGLGNGLSFNEITTFLTFGAHPDPFHHSNNPSGVFYFGLLIYIYACYKNISKSDLGWGLAQNVIQTIMVILFSVIIVGLTLIVKDTYKKLLDQE